MPGPGGPGGGRGGGGPGGHGGGPGGFGGPMGGGWGGGPGGGGGGPHPHAFAASGVASHSRTFVFALGVPSVASSPAGLRSASAPLPRLTEEADPTATRSSRNLGMNSPRSASSLDSPLQPKRFSEVSQVCFQRRVPLYLTCVGKVEREVA